MSTGRYYFAIGAGAATMAAVVIFALTALDGESFSGVLGRFVESIIISYFFGAPVTELIFWDYLPMNVLKVIFGFSILPLTFAWSLIQTGADDHPIIGLIGLLLLVPCLSITGTIIAFGATVFVFLSAAMCIYHIFALRNEIY